MHTLCRLLPILLVFSLSGCGTSGDGEGEERCSLLRQLMGSCSKNEESASSDTVSSNQPASSSGDVSSAQSSESALTKTFAGAAVDGPIANAQVNVYRLDVNVENLQGALLVQGSTDAQARFTGLEIDADEQGPFLIVVSATESTIDLNTGMPPIISEVRTVVSSEQVSKPVYATPLTSIAVTLAAKKAGTAATAEEFSQGLKESASEVVSALGFGMEDDVDIFTASPIVNDDTDSNEKLEQVAKYRTAISGAAAVIFNVQKNTNERLASNSTSSISANTIMEDIAKDLSDGAIDGKAAGDETLGNYSATEAAILVETDPAKLIIPGTDKTVEETEQLLHEEAADTGTTANTTALSDGSVNTTAAPAQADIDRDKDGVINSRDAFPNDPKESVDTDGDGVGNNADPDDDNDGVRDELDAFPLNASEKLDTDGDGIGNNADSDDDGDGVPDVDDDFPLDASKSNAADIDNDGWPSDQDLDDNNAEIPGFAFVDTDGDGIGNTTDPDDDNDGVPDEVDDLPLDETEASDTDGDGIGDRKDDDIDGDGVPNHNNGDDVVNTPETRVLKGGDAFPFNPNEAYDLDRDGIGDNADSDADGDGLLDINDPDPTQWDTDSDGVKDGKDALPLDPNETLDSDFDGVGNNADNCPYTSNANQTDTDSDGLGNACDDDDDGDGVPDSDDDFPLDPNASSATDADNDGWPLGQDTDDNDNTVPDLKYVDTDGDGLADEGGLAPDNDDDNDGYNDDVDAFPTNPAEFADADMDGIGNNEDTDNDNDGVPDAEDSFPFDSAESVDSDLDGVGDQSDSCPLVAGPQTDTDGDGFGDVCDNDDDNDGVEDRADRFPLNPAESKDTDGDGIGNNEDTDDDGDGVSDEQERINGTNPLKRDTDADSIGDGDDNCPLVSNSDQNDADSNGIGDACDRPVAVGGYYLLHTEVLESSVVPAELDVDAIGAYECEAELGEQDAQVALVKADGEHGLLFYFADDKFAGEGLAATIAAGGQISLNTMESGADAQGNWMSSATFSGTVAASNGVITGELHETYKLEDEGQQLLADCFVRSLVTFTPMTKADAPALIAADSGYVSTDADVVYEDPRLREWRFEYELLNTQGASLYTWNGSDWVLETEPSEWMVLTGDGWVQAADSLSISQANGNTAVVQDLTVDGAAYANWNVEFFSVDIDGQLMANLLGEGWGEAALLDSTATFGAGAQAVALHATNDSDVYEINCGRDDWADTGLDCVNFVQVPAGEASNYFAYATSLDEVVHGEADSPASIHDGIVIGRDPHDGLEIFAYIQTDAPSLVAGALGTVTFYWGSYDGHVNAMRDESEQAVTASWVLTDPLDDGSHLLLEFDIPDYIAHQFDYWFDSQIAFLTVTTDSATGADVVRLGEKSPANSVHHEVGINSSALQDVLASFNAEMPVPEGENLVRNGGFEAAEGEYQGWYAEAHQMAVADMQLTAEVSHSGNQSFMVNVITADSAEWAIQAGSRFINVNPGESYTYMAWVKASQEGGRVSILTTKRSYPFNGFVRQETWVGSEWQRLIGEVYIPEDSVGEVRIPINFSFPENEGLTFYIDDIQLWGNPAVIPEVEGTNIAVNGDLELSSNTPAGWSVYPDDGAVTMSLSTDSALAHNGNHSLLLNISDDPMAAVASASFGMLHLVEGERYTVTAWVKGTVGAELEMVLSNTSGQPLGMSDELRMTGEWQPVRFQVDASWGVSSVARLYVFTDKTGNEGATFYIDDVEIWGQSAGEIWPEGEPLILNTGFEGDAGIAGWYTSLGETDVSVAAVNTEAYAGESSAQISIPSGLNSEYVSFGSDFVSVQSGTKLAITAWIMGTQGTVVDVYFNSDSGFFGPQNYTVPMTGLWQQVYLEAVVPEGVNTASVNIVVVDAPVGAQVYIDEAQLWGSQLGNPDPKPPLESIFAGLEGAMDLAGWVTTAQDSVFSIDTTEAFEGSQSLRVDIGEPGVDPWSTQTGYGPVQLERGRMYQFVARVKGEVGSLVRMTATENETWNWYGGTSAFVMDGTWQTIALDARMHYHGTGDVLLLLDFGYAENANTSFYVDAIEIIPTEIIDVTRDMNRGFEFDDQVPLGWYIDGDKPFYVDSSQAFAGANALTAQLDDVIPEASWQTSVSLRGVQVVPGNDYQFGGWVKGSIDSVIQIFAQTNGYPWETYGDSGEVVMTGEWQWVEFSVAVPEGGAEFLALATHMAFPGNENATVTLDEYGLWGQPAMMRPEGHNLVHNSSLEDSADDIAPWVVYHAEGFAGTVALSSNEAHSGVQSLYVSVDADYADPAAIQVGQGYLAVQPLGIYESEMWVKGTAGAQVNLTITSDDGLYEFYAAFDEPVVMNGDWQLLSLPFTVPAISTGRARILAEVAYPENVGAEFFFDDAAVWAIGIAPNYDTTDSDNDGVADVYDAFPNNPEEQYDFDGDGIGDNSDDDIDGDGVSNALDGDAFNPDIGELADRDSDGIADVYDNCVDIANPFQFDDNFNGVGNECESPLATVNAGFEDAADLTGWVTTADDATFTIETVEVFEGSQSVRVDIGDPGPERWSTQIGYGPTLLERGRVYQFIAQVKGEAGSRLRLSLIENQTWNWFGGVEDIVMDGAWQTVAFEALVPNYSSGEAIMFLDMGYAENANSTFYIDSAEIIPTEKIDITRDMNGGLEREPLAPLDWIIDGDKPIFIDDSEPFAGAYALTAELDGVVPEASWQTGASLVGVQVMPGADYKFVGKVKGTPGSTVQIFVQANGIPYETYGSSGEMMLNGDWQWVHFPVHVGAEGAEFVALATHMAFAGNEYARISLDEFSLVGVPAEPRSMGENIAFNGSLEESVDDIAPWVIDTVDGYSGEAGLTTADAHSGVQSLRLTVDAAYDEPGAIMVGMSDLPVNPLWMYEAEVWVKGTAGAALNLHAFHDNDFYQHIAGLDSVATMTGDWQQITLPFTVPSVNTGSVRLLAEVAYSENAGAEFFFDDISVVAVGVATDYDLTDSDNDGVIDSRDAFPNNPEEQYDLDGDGIGDNSDDDIDGDGVANAIDEDPYNADIGAIADRDNDGVADSDDNCLLVANPDQLDDDDNGLGNACDLDVAGPFGVYLAERTYSADNQVYTEETGTCEADTSTVYVILETHTEGNQLFMHVRGEDERESLNGVIAEDGTITMLDTESFTGDGIYYAANNAFELQIEDFTGSADGTVSCYAQGTVIANAPAQVAEKTITDSGVTWFEGEYLDTGNIELELGTLMTGAEEVIEFWNDTSLTWEVDTVVEAFGALTDSGAMMVPDRYTVTGFVDGSESAIIAPMLDGSPVDELTQHVQLEAFPVEGIPMATFLDDAYEDLLSNAVFSAGAQMYVAHIRQVVDNIRFWCDDDYDAWFENHLACDNIIAVDWVESGTESGVYEPKPALSLDELVLMPSAFPEDNSYLPFGGIWVGEGWSGVGRYNLMAYLVSDSGSVQDNSLNVVYFQQFESGGSVYLGDGSVIQSQVGSTDVYALDIPGFIGELVHDGYEGRPAIFEESDIEGTSIVRRGEMMMGGYAETGLVFNATAKADILGALPSH